MDADDKPKGRATAGPPAQTFSLDDEPWSTAQLCEAFAARKNWRSRRGGRLDVYRAANWILRAALAGKGGVDLAFLPPPPDADSAQCHLETLFETAAGVGDPAAQRYLDAGDSDNNDTM